MKCLIQFPFVFPDHDSVEACRCMHICQCHFLQLSRFGSPQAPPHQPIRSQIRCPLTNERREISPAWGLKLFTIDRQDTLREKKQRCSLIYIHLPENTFIKEPHFGKRSVLLGCYPLTRHEVPLIFENIQKTFHQGFRQTSLLTVFLVKFLIWETFEVGFCFYCSL